MNRTQRTILSSAAAAAFCLLVGQKAQSAIGMAEARNQLEAASDPGQLFSLSFYFERAGRPFSALKAVERAIDIRSDVPGYHARHGQLLSARKRFKEAGKAYGRAADTAKDAKSFRGAQARALEKADSRLEAAQAWEKLVGIVIDSKDSTELRSKEALDAARRSAVLYSKLNDHSSAERVWRRALAGLEPWQSRLTAADGVAGAILARGDAPGAARFWIEISDTAPDWNAKALVAQKITDASFSSAAGGERATSDLAVKAWESLRASASSVLDRQRSAVAVADIHMRTSRPGEAAACLESLIEEPGVDRFTVAGVLSKAYVHLGSTEKRRALWQDMFDEHGTTLRLEAGKRYDIRLEYYENGGDALIRLLWSSASHAKQAIPAESLYVSDARDSAHGLRGEYFRGRKFSGDAVVRVDPSVDFTWKSDKPHPRMPSDSFAVRWTGQVKPNHSEAYTFHTVSDDGVRLWVNGVLVIDNWTDHGTTEDSSTGQRKAILIARDIVATMDSARERADFWRAASARFSGDPAFLSQLADALEFAGDWNDALTVNERLHELMVNDPAAKEGLETCRQNMMSLCGKTGDLARAGRYIDERFKSEVSPGSVKAWLDHLRTGINDREVVGLALKTADASSDSALAWRMAGCAAFLATVARADQADRLFEAVAGNAAVDRKLRRQALDSLLSRARTLARRIELRRRIIEVSEKNNIPSYVHRQLAADLARAGRIPEALDAYRYIGNDGSWRRQYYVREISRNVIWSNRIGPGLRTDEGCASAERAFAKFYRARLGDDVRIRTALGELARKLAEVRVRRGQVELAGRFIGELMRIKDRPDFHTWFAGVHSEREDLEEARAEYLRYFDAASADYVESLTKMRHPSRRSSLPGVDGAFVAFFKKDEHAPTLAGHVEKSLSRFSGLRREAAAELFLKYLKNTQSPDKMIKFIDRVERPGLTAQVYRNERTWAEAAIRMKNSKSKADTRMRDHLMKQLEVWKSQISKNPEDYQAVFNLYKTCMQLGRGEEARPLLDKAVAISPGDPVILDIVGREYMLDKNYAGAAEAIVRAGEASGAKEGFEGSVVSAFELSGNVQEAVSMAIDSLAAGRNHGKGVRTIEQIMDMAERSNGLKLAFEQTRDVLREATASSGRVSDTFARLALRLAWDHADVKMATSAIDALILNTIGKNLNWSTKRMLSQLAQDAVSRKRIADGVRIKMALLRSEVVRGNVPQAAACRAIAMLQLRNGDGAGAAATMFTCMNLAMRMEASIKVDPSTILRAGTPPPADLEWISTRTMSGGRTEWARAILGMVVAESESGSSGFREACGPRLTMLLESERLGMAQRPDLYRGAITDPGVEAVLGLRDSNTRAFREAAGPEASADIKLAYVRRLVSLRTRKPVKARDLSVTLRKITEACASASAGLTGHQLARVRLACARFHKQLLYSQEGQPIEGFTSRMVIDMYEGLAGTVGHLPMKALLDLKDIAIQEKMTDGVVRYCKMIHEANPLEGSRRQYASALLSARRAAEAAALLREGLKESTGNREFREAADLLMQSDPMRLRQLPADNEKDGESPEKSETEKMKELLAALQPEATRAASEFYAKAISRYLEEVGSMLKADGTRLPDPELGRLRLLHSRALAAKGELGGSAKVLLSGIEEVGAGSWGRAALHLVAAAHLIENKIDDLIALIEHKSQADPDNVKLLLAFADACEAGEKYSKAAQAMYAARALDPQLSTVKRLIDLFRKAGDPYTALDETRAWVAAFPRDAEAYRVLSEIYSDLGEKNNEVRALTMLVGVAPRDAANCRSVAVLFAERDDYRRATSLMRRAIEIRPEEPYRHIDLAEVLLMAGNSEEAVEVAREALERDWEKGLSPELLRRMPSWRGTFEVRGYSVLADALESAGDSDGAARERLKLPAGYKRPALKDAIPEAAIRLAERLR